MFVKRLNKIYAPPIIEAPRGHRQFNNDRNKQSVSIIPANLSKQYDDSRFDKQLKVFSMSIDPHGRYVCFYSEQHDEIYIVSIVTLLDHVDKFRKEYASDSKYSFKSSLKPQVIIKNPRNALNIFQIKFSHCLQNTQFLVVVYYSGVIDMYSVLSGKKIDSFNLLDKQKNPTQQAGISPLFNVNVMGHSILISTYDGKLFCYEGKEFGICSKYKDEWIRIGYDGIQWNSKEEQENENKKINNRNKSKQKKNKKAPIYYSFNGELKNGDKVIQKQINPKQIIKKMAQQAKAMIQLSGEKAMSESFEEYIRLQFDKVSSSGLHMQYSFSLCERFIICKNQMENQKRIIYYSIRSREHKWALFAIPKLYNYPTINHFWGINYNGKMDKQIKDRTNFIKHCLDSDTILIAVIGDYKFSRNEQQRRQKQPRTPRISRLREIQGETTISILKLYRVNNTYRIGTVCQMKDAKHNIVIVHWIGPNILVYLDEVSNVYYLEIKPQILMQ